MKRLQIILFFSIPLLIFGQSNEKTYKFVGVGDMMLGTNYPSESYLPPKGTNVFENVSTVLKDLENQDKEFKKEQEASEVKQEEVFTEKVGPTMTISEIDLLRQQLHGCLNLNVGVANLKEIKPVIYIEVNPDRTAKSSKVVNKEKLNDPSFRTAAEAAMRAVNNPDCSPLLLPADKYEQWKEINFTFDFSWMFD